MTLCSCAFGEVTLALTCFDSSFETLACYFAKEEASVPMFKTLNWTILIFNVNLNGSKKIKKTTHKNKQ